MKPDDARRILAEFQDGRLWILHCKAAASLALKLGKSFPDEAGMRPERLEVLGLMHDVGRSVTNHPVDHGLAGWQILNMRGHQPEAYFCAAHVKFGQWVPDGNPYDVPSGFYEPAAPEEKLVALCDLMLEGEQPTALSKRFQSLEKRYAGKPEFLAALPRAHSRCRQFLMEMKRMWGLDLEQLAVTK